MAKDSDQADRKNLHETLDTMPSKYAVPLGKVLVLCVVGTVFFLISAVRACVHL